MSLRLLVWICLFIGVQSAGASAQELGNPELKQEPGPAAPPAPVAVQPTAAPETEQPTSAAPEQPAAPAPSAAPVVAAAPAVTADAPPRQQLEDLERAPDHVVLPPAPGLFSRVALGIGVALLATSEESVLRLPGSLVLDVGYGFTPDLAALLRVESWLSFDKAALQFLGAGARFGVAPESMFVTTLLGVSIFGSEGAFQGGETVQGLALQVDVGQAFVLSDVFHFEIGARFELGTPLFASDVQFTSVGVGPFLALRVGG